MDTLLKSIYFDLKSPLAYTSRQNVYKAAKKKMPSIRKKDVNLWFEKQLSPTLHKPVRYHFKRNKTVVMRIGDQFQSDLCDMSNIAEYNDHFNFLLTCIDCFSRYAWSIPIKRKTGVEIARVLEDIFKQKTCKRLQTDKGKEYLNKHVKSVLQKYNIDLWTSENEEGKAALIERFNRTLKSRMYKYFTENNTLRYVDILPQLVNGYNHTTHRSIGMAPAHVSRKHEMKLRQKLYGKTGAVSKKYKYNISDYVRISKARRVFRKGYLPSWSEEIFKIIGRQRKFERVYELEDFNGQLIEGKFYEKELQKIQLPEEYRIEKVIRKKKKGNKNQYFVKWLGWDNSFNSWVDDLTVL